MCQVDTSSWAERRYVAKAWVGAAAGSPLASGTPRAPSTAPGRTATPSCAWRAYEASVPQAAPPAWFLAQAPYVVVSPVCSLVLLLFCWLGRKALGSEGSRSEERPVAGQPSKPARIVVADDHPLFRSALRTLLEGSEEVEVIAEATDGKETLELSRRLEPDLVLMDMIMPKMDGVAATRAIKSELPRTIVLVMTASEDSEHLLSALRAGAGGYVLKSADPEQITEAIHKVLEHEF